MDSGESAVGSVRGAGLRILISFGSLTTGQLLLGERDANAIVRRSAVGSLVAETAAQFIRFAQTQGDMNSPLDPLLIASYGDRELAKFCFLVQTSSLRSRSDGSCP